MSANPSPSSRVPWRLLASALVLAALVAWLLWPAKKKTVAAAWAHFDRTRATRIAIHRPGHPAVVLQKQNGAWRLTQPYAAASDQSTVRSLLSELSSIQPDRKLGAVSHLASYGLDHPASITIGLASGKQMRYLFGNSAPTGEGDYLKLASSPEVVLAPDYLKADSLHGPFNFQDKSLLHFKSSAVTAVSILYQGRRARFHKVHGKWPARSQTIGDLVDSLKNATINKIADPNGKDLARYGLAHPAIQVRLNWQGGGGSLEIGKKTNSGDYYARSSARPAVVTISSYLLDDMKKLAQSPKPAPIPKPPKSAKKK